MLLVLLIHYVPTRTTPSPESLENDFWGTVINLELKSLSFVCVNCFVLISGYFGIKWRLKSFSNLLFQVLFWLAVGIVLSRVLNLGDSADWLIGSWKYLKARWFISAYVCLYIVAPLINAFVGQASQRQLGLYIILFYLFSTVYGYFILAEEFNEGMSMISLVGIYLTGAYLRRYSLRITSFKASVDLLVYLSLGVLLVLCSLIVYRLGINKSLYGYLNPLVLLSSVYLFLFFKKINIGHIRLVNFVAASAFAVYLFHMHPMIYGTYQRVCHSINDSATPAILVVPIFFISIFVFCVLVDRIRIVLFNAACAVGNHLCGKDSVRVPNR